jgi:hypothetical protein
VADAAVLVAACSGLLQKAEPMRALLHQRRAEQALELARALESTDPRLALVEVWLFSESDLGSPQYLSQLDATLAAFEAWPRPYDVPSWGEAEALVLLGAAYFENSDVRAARDSVEAALLAAPGFNLALQLQRRLLAVSN